MSLLIKALDKAENDKVEHSNTKQKQAEKNKAKGLAGEDLELSLSPTGSSLGESGAASAKTSSRITEQNNSVSASSAISSASPKSAANVFSAKGVGASNQNTRLALIGGAGLLALLAMGLYFYQFVDNTPDVVIPQRPIAQSSAPEPQSQQPEAVINAAAPAQIAEAAMPPAFVPDETALQVEKPVKKMSKKPAFAGDEAIDIAEPPTNFDEPVVPEKANKKIRKSKDLQFGEAIASKSASISVTKTTPQVGVNPTLMSAYEAYNTGNDSDAQKLYKQVLQRDIRNVDALLGLGAIASRQGRIADANGWYAKVLEVDPRNSIAQAAMLDSQPQGNEANSESNLKNMLAKHPNDANLHAALGNLYAEQNQWPAAQQAYFDAYSLNSSADNAFNLAVSLDQMGKPKLALPYYQRALEQASSTSSIDKAALEARIAAIQ
jgi:tetratricopeptide (TPR) repeat protein